MKKTYALVIALLAFAAGSVGGYLYRGRASARADEKYQSFCYVTWHSIRQDRLDFESGEPQRQQEASRRFFATTAMHHNTQSIEMCLDELPIIDCAPEDWGCKAKHAALIEKQLYDVTHR